MKKIKLLTPILGISTLAVASMPIAGCSCSQSINVELDQSVIDKGIKVKSAYIAKGKDSYIELEIPSGETIQNVILQIGDLTCSKNVDHLRIDGNRIWISAYNMVDSKVIVKWVKFVPKLIGMSATSSKPSFEMTDIIKPEDIEVTLDYDDGSKSKPLIWNDEYIILKNGVELTDFGTNGYMCSGFDAIAGKATFGLQYVTDKSIIGTFSVGVTAEQVDILTCSWSDIDKWCTKLENGEITEDMFCYHFTNGTQQIETMDGFVGIERTISVNNQNHVVRIIGTQHDKLASDETKKAALTFEFANLVSDEDGYALSYLWNDVVTDNPRTLNFDYVNSSMRKALGGNETTKPSNILVARKGANNFDNSGNYNKKTVFEMLPNDLANVIKPVKKSMGVCTNVETREYNPVETTEKLFLLSANEMGEGDRYDAAQGTAYTYYEDILLFTDSRVKKHIANDGVDNYATIAPGSGQAAATEQVQNFAGFIENGGCPYWTRSPYAAIASCAFLCSPDGSFIGSTMSNYVNTQTYGIAPGFCI